MKYKAKILLNKKNQQLIIFLSRRKLDLLVDKENLLKNNPKFLNIQKEDLEF